MLQGITGVSFAQNPYIAALAAQRTQAAGVSRTVTPAGAVPAAQPGKPVEPVEPVRATPATASVQDETDLVRRWQADPAALAARGRMQQLDGEALAQLRADAGGAVSNASARAKAAYGAAQAVGQQLAQGAAPANAALTNAAPLPGMGKADAAPGNGAAQAQAAQAVGLPQAAEAEAAAQGSTAKSEPALAGLEGLDALQGGDKTEEAKSAREVMEDAECETCKERKYQDGSDDPGVSFKTAAHIAPEQAAAKVRGHEMEHVTREQAKAAREGREVVSQSVSYKTAICPECGRVYVAGGTTRTTTLAKSEPFAVGRSGDGKEGSFSTMI